MNKQILLIDDDEDELYFFTEALSETRQPYQCISAKSVEEGMKVLNHTKPEFIFLDINMPRINGFEGLELIKKQDTFRNIPVILYSTAITEEVMEKGTLQGAIACMQKTGSIITLAENLRKFLDQRSLLPSENPVSLT
ncbi:MAG: response regulator [Williamsia sp.]|nr:response regulator [Williamsia sp.]